MRACVPPLIGLGNGMWLTSTHTHTLTIYTNVPTCVSNFNRDLEQLHCSIFQFYAYTSTKERKKKVTAKQYDTKNKYQQQQKKENTTTNKNKEMSKWKTHEMQQDYHVPRHFQTSYVNCRNSTLEQECDGENAHTHTHTQEKKDMYTIFLHAQVITGLIKKPRPLLFECWQ